MEKNVEKYLPLGSVVLLKNATKRIMIIGYAATAKENPDKVWDYVGCVYPEGQLSSEKSLLLMHEDIAQIYAIGYSDDETIRFINFLKNKLNQ